MHLKVRCAEKRCPDYNHEQIIEVGALRNFLNETGTGVTCGSCRSLMKIVAPPANTTRRMKRSDTV